MDQDNTIAIHLDYREAFVLDMEMASHGLSCKQCMVAALKSDPERICDQMTYMRTYIKRAYESLPPHYKSRYDEAIKVALAHNVQITKKLTSGR